MREVIFIGVPTPWAAAVVAEEAGVEALDPLTNDGFWCLL